MPYNRRSRISPVIGWYGHHNNVGLCHEGIGGLNTHHNSWGWDKNIAFPINYWLSPSLEPDPSVLAPQASIYQFTIDLSMSVSRNWIIAIRAKMKNQAHIKYSLYARTEGGVVSKMVWSSVMKRMCWTMNRIVHLESDPSQWPSLLLVRDLVEVIHAQAFLMF